VCSLTDTEVILRDGEEWKTRDQVESLSVSESVRTIIQSRVDRLESDSKLTLQAAAVIGPVFQRRILSRIIPPEVNLDNAPDHTEEKQLSLHLGVA